MRPSRLLLVLTSALLLAACGDDDPPSHGMAVGGLPDAPEGDAIQIRYALDPDELWVAELVLEARQERQEGRKSEKREAGAMSTLALEQRYLGGAPAKSETRLRYLAIQSVAGEAVDAPAGETIGVFVHQASGRPDPTSLRLSGQHVAENQTLYRSLLLAGLAGTDMWLPARPVRPGEAWRAAESIDPQMIKAMNAVALRPGATLPPATIQGAVRLERVEDGPDGKILVLRIDALVEMVGTVTSGRRVGQMSFGYHIEGTAHVDARTGIPVMLDTRAEMNLSEKSAGDEMTWRLRLSLTGTAKRETP